MQKDFKEQFVDKIEEFLKDRMEVFDKFRLKNTKNFLTAEEVYNEYRMLLGIENEEYPLRFPYYRECSVSIGASVFFDKEEKERIFAIIREYFLKTDVVKYPNLGKGYARFIADILEFLISSETITKERKEELSKLAVSLNCIDEFLSLNTKYEELFCVEGDRFYIQDYVGKEFVSITSSRDTFVSSSYYYIVNFTSLNPDDLEVSNDYKRALQSKKD